MLEDCVSWMEELLAVADVAGNLMTVVWSGDHLAAGRKARWSWPTNEVLLNPS